MKKDVLVTVRGMQSIESVDGSEEVEMVAKGNYYFRNGHHFICYEEMSEGFDKPTKSMIKIADNVVEVDKKGVMNTHLVFEPEKKNVTFYATPFGQMEMGIAATKIAVQEEEENLSVSMIMRLKLIACIPQTVSFMFTYSQKKQEIFVCAHKKFCQQ